MHWPWGSEVTKLQAQEAAKYLLSISQATLIGAVGLMFLSESPYGFRASFALAGICMSIFLFFFAMKLLKGVNIQ